MCWGHVEVMLVVCVEEVIVCVEVIVYMLGLYILCAEVIVCIVGAL